MAAGVAPASPDRRIVLLRDRAGALSETFIDTERDALRAIGRRVDEEVLERWALDSRRARAWAVTRLAARHPLGVARDLAGRRRWRAGEDVPPLRYLAPAALRCRGAHLHAHFAGAPALAAMRIAAVTGGRWSFIGHGHDVFRTPANLPAKLRAAAFACAPCEYVAAHLRSLAPVEVHVIVMGVEGERFRRRTPPPGGRTVLAVGRLVEKKGFGDLAAAARRLPDVRVRIAGDGPLRGDLDGVELLGPVPHEQVRELLEEADLLCMPCVVARDGDRDAMPVVVKEALAMEVPVVATDEVGLPEIVRPEFGTLVAPRDPAALAAAIAAELARPAAERAERGRAGRAFVLEHADPRREAEKLSRLIG